MTYNSTCGDYTPPLLSLCLPPQGSLIIAHMWWYIIRAHHPFYALNVNILKKKKKKSEKHRYFMCLECTLTSAKKYFSVLER